MKGYLGKVDLDVIKRTGINFGPCTKVGLCDRDKCLYQHVDEPLKKQRRESMNRLKSPKQKYNFRPLN